MTWWVWYIDPTEPQGSPWRSGGQISGPGMTADEAIAAVLGRRFDQPFWAFALDKGEFGAFYDLHYPPGMEPTFKRDSKLGPSGYAAVAS